MLNFVKISERRNSVRKVYIGLICLSVVLCAVFGTLLFKQIFSSGASSTADSATTDEAKYETSEIVMEQGEARILELDSDEEGKLEEWSCDSDIVTVDSGGRVDAKASGKCIVTAGFSDGSREYIITVNKASAKPAVNRYTSAITANQDAVQKNLKKKGGKLPYEIRVNRKESCVTVYTYDEKGEYTVPVRAMICSCGKDNRTTTGKFTIYFHAEWHPLVQDVYGQYASSFSDELLFHSVPYTALENDTLEVEEFNKLGTPASKGCVRMSVSDCKWICDNCVPDTSVIIYDSDDPGPLGKPEMIRITDLTCGWEPTDPDPRNPYGKKAPQISGASDVTISAGSDYDAKEGVTATDTCDNDITDKLEIIGNVVPERAGVYKVTYRVTDVLNRTAEKEITVTVEDND